MKNYSMKPTEENVLELLQKDPIGRYQSVLRFIKLLSCMEDDCYSIAVNGEWGSGKTFFIKQVKLILDAYNPQSSLDSGIREVVSKLKQDDFDYPESYTTVYYDAWANDNQTDPILSLIYATISSHQSDFEPSRRHAVGETVAAIANKITGQDVSSILSSFLGVDRLEEVKETAGIRELVNDFVDALIQEHGNRLIFFIDELDRCKPDYAIRFLERIKHYFDDERVTFVFSVSLSQLQWTVKSYYGTEYNATRYLDKFFDLRLSLPRIDYDRFLRNRLEMNTTAIYDKVCIETAKYFDFSLREVERYIRVVKIARKAAMSISSGFSEHNASLFSVTCVVPIVLGLQMFDMEAYGKFISGEDSTPMLDILLKPNIDRFMSLLKTRDEELEDVSNDVGRDTASIKDRLRRVYAALFGKTHDFGLYGTTIGEMRFSEETRRIVAEIAALLSPMSDYDF